MKKINVTIIAAAAEEYPGCADILGSYSEIEVVARPDCLDAADAWSAISCSDVLVLDEVALHRGGAAAIHAIYQNYPMIKLLLIVDISNESKVLDALAMGVNGIIERVALVSMVRKAIPALYAGESWVSRTLVESLHKQLVYLESDALPGAPALPCTALEKLN